MTAHWHKNKGGPQGLRGVFQYGSAANDQGPTDSPDFRQLKGFHNNFGTDSGWVAHGNRQKGFGLLSGGHTWVTGALVI